MFELLQRRLALPVLLLGGSAVLGMLVVRQPVIAVVLMLGLLGLWMTIEARLRPIIVGILMLAYMNAIPVVDLVVLRLPGGIRFDDLVMGALLVLGIAWTWEDGARTPIGRLRLILLITFAYWIVVLVKTVVTGDGTLVLSAFYGRDLLAMVMALSIAAIARDEGDAELLTAVLVGGACLYSIGHILQFVAGVDTSFITHPYKVGEAIGTARIFSKAMALVVPALVLALGRAVVATAGVRRIWYWIASGLLIIEILIEFTRANYLGLIIALVLGAVVLVRAHTDRPQSRAAVALVSLGVVATGTWMASGTAAFRAWLASSAVTARFTSASTDVAAQGGTFGYRLRLYETMLGVLGRDWPWGVGFWHPAEHYVALLPQGSVRNNDTGLLAILMTLGVIGVVIIVWPLVMTAIWGVRALRVSADWIRATGWSAITYAVWVLFTSFSLGFLAYGAGLAATAVVVGLMTGAWHHEQEAAGALDQATQ